MAAPRCFTRGNHKCSPVAVLSVLSCKRQNAEPELNTGDQQATRHDHLALRMRYTTAHQPSLRDSIKYLAVQFLQHSQIHHASIRRAASRTAPAVSNVLLWPGNSGCPAPMTFERIRWIGGGGWKARDDSHNNNEEGILSTGSGSAVQQDNQLVGSSIINGT
ncbi:hypothetical protein GGX14DRAFT_391571 [Mycena pura]|uniref:Uncharacterized protein n=1 Tax=Mycena pura TaxID=153505 RepID=A0AAD6YEV7_9AGAR|nr:hypothetical protein GGX14DRAFT_391571 [Mycena pura]